MNLLHLETQIVELLKTVYDPEIPVNIYDLGLIYDVGVDENNAVTITMTLTAPNCPLADDILNEVVQKVKAIETVQSVNIKLVFEPQWSKEMMSEEALLELGFL
jgi:FeS assembly SUF system protein